MADEKDSDKPSLWGRVRSWFSKDKLSKDLEKMEELTEKELEHRELEERLFEDHHEKPSEEQESSREHHKLGGWLRKAGFGIGAKAFKKRVFFSAVVFSLVLSAVVIVLGSVHDKGPVDVLVFMAGFWSAGFVLVLLLFALGAAALIDVRIHQRRKELEEVLPDYYQLVAANIGAGMSIDRALWYAVRPRFGVLAKEIEDVAKRVLTGEELPDALRDFSRHYDSEVLQRSINLLLEGIAAGGEIADLLHKISTDIQEQRILRQEMAANVMTYVIFISFASVLAAPVLFGLATQLLVVIKSIAANIGTEASAGSLSVSPDVILLSDFKLFSVVLLSATSVMSALIISVIRKGEVFEGLRFVPVFVVVSLALYFASVWMFGSLFAGLI